ncbi:MAG: hypothetical protein KDN22_21325 [Verrucomicrobiae bacterium]|nr:hypothetical protein [Verrucomicrobiae bacterium]
MDNSGQPHTESGNTEVTGGAVPTVHAVGSLPQFPERDGIFIANLLGLFFDNEKQTRMLIDEVGELDSYGGRLVPIVDLLFPGKGENLLVLESEPDAALCRYFTETAGLTLPEISILPHREYLGLASVSSRSGGNASPHFEETLRKHTAAWIDGYVTDNIIERLAGSAGKRQVSTQAGSRNGNNKWRLHEHLVSQGLPTPATVLAHSVAEVKPALAEIARRGFAAGVVKAPVGASGIGLIKVPSLADCDRLADSVPNHFFHDGPCLVQGWLGPGQFGITMLRSPSVQIFVTDEAVVLYDITEQILSQASIHEGNESPPPYLFDRPEWRAELLRQAGVAAQWLREQGYRGTASADFLLAEKQDGGFDVYVCEVNARVTGATYPSLLACHFMPEGAWLLRNLRFSEPLAGAEMLDILASSGDLFVPGRSEAGVLPVNFNKGPDGRVHKGQFLCIAHSTAGSHTLLKLAELDLPCLPDRD